MQGFIRTKRNKLIKGIAFIHSLVQIPDREAFTDAACPANWFSTCSTLIRLYNAQLVTDELMEQTAHPAHKRWPAPAWQKWLAHAEEAPHSITSSWDLCCSIFHVEVHKGLDCDDLRQNVADNERFSPENLSQRSVHLITHTPGIQERWFCYRFQRSTITVWMHTSLCFSFSNLISWSMLVRNTAIQMF